MHVVLQHEGLANDGGVSVDVRNLERGLRELGVDVVAVASATAAAAEIRRRPRAIVHVFGCLPKPSTFATLALARAYRRTLVWTPVFHPSRPSSWSGYGVLRAMEAFDRVAPHSARLASAVLAATDAEAEFFSRRTRGVVRVIPPGVEEFGPAPAADALDAFRRRVDLREGPVVLMVARDNSRKALPFGVAAFAELRHRKPDAQLLLVGPPAEFAHARDPGVCCPGWLAPPDVELAYHAADTLWVSSLYEGLPRAVIEAWRCGLPAVTTDRVALAPLVSSGAGHVVPYGDIPAAATALHRMLEDGETAKAKGAAGRRLVEERFLLRQVVAATESLYRELRR